MSTPLRVADFQDYLNLTKPKDKTLEELFQNMGEITEKFYKAADTIVEKYSIRKIEDREEVL